MTDLLKQMERVISARGLLKRSDSILVGVSGGLDSMVLLHLLHALSVRYSWRISVAHLNHQLRGNSSNADQRLVIKEASALGLRIATGRADVKKLARTHKLSLEMAARKARHEFLAREARRRKIGIIALAHHADDQVELFFLRLLRGSGNDGLAGMKWQSVSPADKRIRLIRPLLEISKATLKEYARRQRIPFRDDATNELTDFQRNRIRRELLPLLRRNYQPAIDRIVPRLMEMAGGEADFVGGEAAKWFNGNRRDSFERLHPAVQRRCLQQQLIQLQIPVDFELVEKLRTRPCKPVGVTTRLEVVRDLAGRILLREAGPIIIETDQRELRFSGRAGEVVFAGLRIEWRVSGQKRSDMPKSQPFREVFDAAKVGKSVVLRHWRAGDRFQPIGMASAVKLQDLFANQKISRRERHRLAVATTSDGELFWVERLRISERFKVSEKTIHRLQWRWNRL